MNYLVTKGVLLAQPGSTERAGMEWIDLRSIERVKYTPRNSNEGARISVFVSGHEVVVGSAYVSDEAAMRDAKEIAEAAFAARD